MIEPEMNPQDLWLEEIFTDRRVGTIRRMTPVDGSGARDPGRDILFIGETSESQRARCDHFGSAKTLRRRPMFAPRQAARTHGAELQERAASSIVDRVPQGGCRRWGRAVAAARSNAPR